MVLGFDAFSIPLAVDVVVVLTILVHGALALGVLADANALQLEKRYLYLLSPLFWAITTFLTGLLGATIYWLMNRSTLRKD